MSETDHHAGPNENTYPFTGDRGWKGMARSEGEGAFYAIIAGLVLLLLVTALIGGWAGIGVLFVVFTFVTLGVLLVISFGG